MFAKLLLCGTAYRTRISDRNEPFTMLKECWQRPTDYSFHLSLSGAELQKLPEALLKENGLAALFWNKAHQDNIKRAF